MELSIFVFMFPELKIIPFKTSILLKCSLSLVGCFFSINVCFSQPVSYSGLLKNNRNNIISNQQITLLAGISNDESKPGSLYQETHEVTTDAFGNYHILIGAGKAVSGNFNAVLWSDGAYYLQLAPDTSNAASVIFRHTVTLRSPTELKPENLEGMAVADTAADCGTVIISHNRHKRPKKITVDLSSTYVNIRYPADTYPVYRHYEWCDEDRNGTGNGLTLSYSENTTHAFFENSNKLGEVKLYAVPFQELFVVSTEDETKITLTRAKPLENLNQTYAIKGPWKMIYFIEW